MFINLYACIAVLQHTFVRAGIYLTMVMTMAALSIIVCVFVLDLHHRNSDTPVPRWVRWLLFGRLSRCLGLPDHPHELVNQPTGTDRDKDWTHERRQQRSVAGDRPNGRKRLRATRNDMTINTSRCGMVELERRARRQNFVLDGKRVRVSVKWVVWAVAGTSIVRRQNFVLRHGKLVHLCRKADLGVQQDTSTDMNCGLVGLDFRCRRQNCVLADRRASNGCTVCGCAGAADVDVLRRTGSSELHHDDVAVHDESYPDAVTSPENPTNGDRRHSTADTALLLSAIITQLRYITNDMWRHCKRAEIKDEWKQITPITDLR